MYHTSKVLLTFYTGPVLSPKCIYHAFVSASSQLDGRGFIPTRGRNRDRQTKIDTRLRPSLKRRSTLLLFSSPFSPSPSNITRGYSEIPFRGSVFERLIYLRLRRQRSKDRNYLSPMCIAVSNCEAVLRERFETMRE